MKEEFTITVFETLNFVVLMERPYKDGESLGFVEFKVFAVESTTTDEINFINKRFGNEICIEREKLKFRPKDAKESLNNGEVFMSGSIKWDGCSNIKIDEHEKGLLHFCGKRNIEQFAKIMINLYDLASALMPEYAKELNYK